MSLAILFHFVSTQHVSDINISINRGLRLCCWITTSVVLFSVRCVLEIWCGWVSVLQAEARFSLQHGHHSNPTVVVIQQHSRKFLMMDILMSETCWVHKKWNKIASGFKLVFYSSTLTMMHGPKNIRCRNIFVYRLLVFNIIPRIFCELKRTAIISVVRYFKLQNCVHSVTTHGGEFFGMSWFRIHVVLFVRRKRSGHTQP